MKHPLVKNFINGQFTEASGKQKLDVESPLDGTVIAQIGLSNSEDLGQAVKSAKTAQKQWEKTPIKERVQVFFRYKQLLEKNGKRVFSSGWFFHDVCRIIHGNYQRRR